MSIRGFPLVLCVLTLGACTSAPAFLGQTDSPGEVPFDLSGAVTASAGTTNGGTIVLHFQPAIETGYLNPSASPGYQTMALVHHWQDSDIYQYQATLQIRQGKTYVDTKPPTVLIVPHTGPNATNTAAFTNLALGQQYQVTAIAQGNQGATAPEFVLSQSPFVAAVSFPKNSKQVSLNVQVTLVPVPFNGTGSATVGPPTDGSYIQPSAPVQGSTP